MIAMYSSSVIALGLVAIFQGPSLPCSGLIWMSPVSLAHR